MKHSSKLTQEFVNTKLEILQIEATALAMKYSWPHKTPHFNVLYSKNASGAFINLETREITLSTRHLQIPHEFVRFTLAHEIAHYHQIITGYQPTYGEIMYLRLNSMLTLLFGLSFVFYSSILIILTQHSTLDSVIAATCFMLYTFITIKLYRVLVTNAREQLFESDADAHAIEIIKDPSAIAYFQMNQKNDLESYLVDKKLFSKKLKSFNLALANKDTINFVIESLLVPVTNMCLKALWMLRYCYNTFFSTHPTDARRIQNLSKLLANQ